MIALILIGAAYLIGYILCYSMMRIEYEAEGETYTKGDRVLTIFLSLLSFLMILFLLVTTWITKINKTGYWHRPLKKKDE